MKMKFLLSAFLFITLYSCKKSDTDSPAVPAPETVKDVDGNVYTAIKIGTQTWMKENLKVTKYNNGDPIPTGLSDASWTNTTSGAFAVYNNNDANNSVYGKLYNWYAAVDPRKIAPVGWHVPSNEEWGTLISFLESEGSAVGGDLKEASYVHWGMPNAGATNLSGFTALPAGIRAADGSYALLGNRCFWWSTDQSGSINSLGFGLLLAYDSPEANQVTGFKAYGASIRCIKDQE